MSREGAVAVILLVMALLLVVWWLIERYINLGR
jgi:hypothetical protein